MTVIELTPEQRRQIGSPPTVVTDPATRKQYVLVPVEEYESVREALQEERDRSALHRAALRNAAARADEAP
ncbi:MAG: hypothetical protein ACREIT_07640 [Tepidisphaeraceae bacterium]